MWPPGKLEGRPPGWWGMRQVKVCPAPSTPCETKHTTGGICTRPALLPVMACSLCLAEWLYLRAIRALPAELGQQGVRQPAALCHDVIY